MNLARGGAFTALTLLVAMGCGGSDAKAPPGAVDENGNPAVEGPAGPDTPPPPAPPPAADGKPTIGVFVSSSQGSDDADATLHRPVKTLARAIALAVEKKTLPIIACAEPFNEAVTLADGIAMYGYYSCAALDWTKTTEKAKVASPTSPAVRAENLKLPTRFEGFEVNSPDMAGTVAAGAAATSSYGMIVKTTTNLSLADVRILSGKGQDGVDGVEPASGNGFVNAAAANGKPAARPVKHSCSGGFCNFNETFGTAPGAAGGKGACQAGPAGWPGAEGGGGRVSVDGVFNANYVASLCDAQPLVATSEMAAGGNPGGNGSRGTFGANGGWAFTGDGYVSQDGTAGGVGLPGQGGGSGAGTKSYGTSTLNTPGGPIPINNPPPGGINRSGIGGGGGAGGCGGLPGTPGRSGGASIGLFVVDSTVTIANTRISTSSGGRGGYGTAGTPGVAGGAGGAAATLPPGTFDAGGPGYAGGAGGAAGQSGHGSPGASISLVFHGARPTTTSVELVPGTAGEGGPAVVDGAQTLAAAERVAKAEHSF